MYNSSAAASTSNSEYKSRLFVYEVVGLSQNGNGISAPIRKSGSVFITVPYSRMNQEMLRIGRMGGKIINIRPLDTSES